MSAVIDMAREVMDRRNARNNLMAFINYTYPQFTPARHHVLICDKLMQFERDVTGRKSPGLLIFTPPRHGKSEILSRRFPAWFMGRNPCKQYVSASYNDDFASDFGREVRNLMGSEDYSHLFPDANLRADSKAANRFHTGHGGIYVSVGVGGSLTGRGADVMSIDDPIRNWEDANSETIRERIWSWYSTVARTRLMPGGGIVITLTRWHDDDLAGRILKQIEAGDTLRDWTVINLPAIATECDELGRQPGNALWPAWYDEKALASIKADMSPMQWSALFQQQPIPESGDYFRKEWFQFFESPPKYLTIYGASDYAVSEEAGDYTEHGVFGLDPVGDLYVLDWWYGKTASNVWIEYQLDLIRQHKPIMWIGESGPIRKSIEPFLMQRMSERKDYCRLEWLSSVHDKPTRARSFQALASSRKVFLPAGKEWSTRLLNQLTRFPAGAEDDAVDVCSLMGRSINMTWTPVDPKAAKVKQISRPGWRCV